LPLNSKKKKEEPLILRVVVAGGAVLLGISAVMAQQDIAKQQDDLMRNMAKSQYGVLLKMSRGQIAYDQAAVDTALEQLEQGVSKIKTTFEQNPKMQLPGAEYVASPKVWEQKPDFDSKIPPVEKTIADLKGKVKDVETLKAAYKQIEDKCDACHDDYRIHLKKK
jgi:cytochrome c556